ncbi:MerR family transcriptional regulator [Promicromonospora kroppenstedtii]|uniref:MerR family transcriptional regulator n=1 Tax=Promicromonospora kroppenstedtii TaxID=440482 RepID=A0ABW7XD04_9MICO
MTSGALTRSLTIGEFAELTHLSVRTLRRYHESGLLEPDRVDPFSGYRYYTAAQIPQAQVIHRLRELDVPLAEVRQILATSDADARAGLVAGHLHRLEAELDRTRAAVVSLRRLLDPAAPPDVVLRAEPARLVAAVAGDVAHDEVLTWYADAMTELDGALAGHEPLGPAGGHYDNALFRDGRGPVLVYRPVADPPEHGRVRPVELPAAELATVVHRGPHDDIDVTYGRLGAWVVEHALAVDGPVHETYLVTPADTPDRSAWRTEVAWPVFRLTP